MLRALFDGRSFHLFTVAGFPVAAHWSLPVALLVTGYGRGGMQGLLLSVLLFASILAHELGHAVVARRRGVPISGIELNFFGGVAKMAAPPRSPNDEVAIALAGPAVSILLGVLGLGLATFAGPAFAIGSTLLWVGGANLTLGVFNLLPALPMDGGRVLRALLAKRRGLVEGTRTAVRFNRVFAIALGALGLWANPWLILMAVMVWSMGTAELRSVLRHEVLSGMGYWHPQQVPWLRYARAADRGRQAEGAPLEPDVVILPPRPGF